MDETGEIGGNESLPPRQLLLTSVLKTREINTRKKVEVKPVSKLVV